MNKKLVFALALAVVLASGAFAGTNGVYAAPVDRDYDTSHATCQGAYRVGPTVPEYMGSTGAGGG